MTSDLKRMFPGQDPAIVKLWQDGLVFMQPEKVEQAIARGVDVNTPYMTGETQSAINKLLTGHVYLDSSDPIHQNPAKKAALVQIVRMIMNEGPDLTQKSVYGGCDLDAIMVGASDHKLAAEVIIGSLLQSAQKNAPVYSFDYVPRFTAATSREHAQEIRTRMRETIIAVHDAVRTKLENPTGLIENDLVTNHLDKIAYWMKPISLPAVEDLPKPSEAEMAAMDRAFAAVSNLDLIAGDFVREGRPPDGNLARSLSDRAKQELFRAIRIRHERPEAKNE